MAWQPDQYDPAAHQRRMQAAQPPQGYPQQQYAPQPYGQYPQQQPEWQQPGARLQQMGPPPRKRRRVFMWVFLAIQALFVIWLIVGLSSAHGSNSSYAATQAANFCDNGGWSPLYSSQAQCLSQYGATLKDAGNAGTAIGAGLVVVFWAVVDVIMGISYMVVRLSRRNS